MTRRQVIFYGAIFAIIVVFSNYAVQFPIGSSYLTWGAISYPFSFLMLDILSEKNPKRDVLRTLRLGIFFAFIPSLFLSEPRFAIASICAFVISQPIDVNLFFFFKKRLPKLWWLRNNASTIIAQFFDTMMFFMLAFFVFGDKFLGEVVIMALLDFSVKIALSVIDTPFFYLFAIKIRQKILPI